MDRPLLSSKYTHKLHTNIYHIEMANEGTVKQCVKFTWYSPYATIYIPHGMEEMWCYVLLVNENTFFQRILTVSIKLTVCNFDCMLNGRPAYSRSIIRCDDNELVYRSQIKCNKTECHFLIGSCPISFDCTQLTRIEMPGKLMRPYDICIYQIRVSLTHRGHSLWRMRWK